MLGDANIEVADLSRFTECKLLIDMRMTTQVGEGAVRIKLIRRRVIRVRSIIQQSVRLITAV